MSDLTNDFVIGEDYECEAPDGQSFGLVPRDFSRRPAGYYSTSSPFSVDMPLIPRDEWSQIIKDKEATKSSLSDIRNTANDGQPIPSLDQNGQGFCWAYSTTACVMLLRAAANQPYVRLSPHAVACKIFNFQDRGAWGALSMEWIAKNGVPSDEYWPQKSMSRQHDNDTTWRDALKHRITEGWLDINVSHPADAELAFEQVATCLLMNQPVVLDFNWWGHSVCGMDLVETDPGQFGIRILNSWSDNWGQNGTAVLKGRKAIPDGACAPRAVVGQ